MLHEIKMAITFEENIDEATAKVLKRSTVGSIFMAFSVVVHATACVDSCHVIIMTIRVDISPDMAESIGKIRLNHKMVNIPKMIDTKVLHVHKIDAPAKIKYIMEY